MCDERIDFIKDYILDSVVFHIENRTLDANIDTLYKLASIYNEFCWVDSSCNDRKDDNQCTLDDL